MNYKCTNAECGWTGTAEESNPLRHGRKAYRCPKCGNEIIKTNYTRVPPTEPGWHWIRGGKEEYDPMVVNVTKQEYNNTLIYEGVADENVYDVDRFTGEWSERLEAPE